MKINTLIAQIKPKKGDYQANLNRIGDIFSQIESESLNTDVLVLPETVISGYFLEGGVRDIAKTGDELFQDLSAVYRSKVERAGALIDICVGFYELHEGKYYNSALYATLSKEEDDPAEGIKHIHRKFFLPTYGVFDEKRFVSRGRAINAFATRFGTVAVLICEDVWHSISATLAALKGAQIIYVISASPGREFTGQHLGNVARWNVLLPGVADEHNVWVVYAGLVGFEGGKGFTGSSQIVDPWGNCVVMGEVTEECVVSGILDLDDVAVARAASPLLADLEAALGDITMQLDQVARRPYQE